MTERVSIADVRKKEAVLRRRARLPLVFRFLPYLGLIALVLLIIAGFWPKPLPVEIAKVSVGRLEAAVNEEGKTRIKHRFTISAPVTGQLRRIPFKAGTEVISGKTVLAV